MFLEKERLILRKFQEEDFPYFCEYALDQERWRLMGDDEVADVAAVGG